MNTQILDMNIDEIEEVNGGILPFIAFIVATDLALIGLTFAATSTVNQ